MQNKRLFILDLALIISASRKPIDKMREFISVLGRTILQSRRNQIGLEMNHLHVLRDDFGKARTIRRLE